MKKGQVVEGVVTRVDFPNKGIVDCEEGICVVKNVIPGQKVRAVINKARKGKAEGRLLEVLESSPIEQESPCSHFGQCGSCIYLSLPYEETLRIKEEQVKRLLAPVLSRQEEEWQFEGIKANPAVFGYRNKMEFTFGDERKDGPLALGMHRRGSFYDIVSATDCQIVDEDYRQILTCTLQFFQEKKEEGLPLSFYHRLRHEGYIRHLLVRKASRTGEILLALVTTTQTAGLLEEEILSAWQERLRQLPLQGEIVGIMHVKNDAQADVVRSDETVTLYGRDYFFEELLGLQFRISLFSFFQTNSLSAELLYRTAREYILGAVGEQEGQIIYDLYSGTGTIAQMLSPVAKKVIGVEIVEEAVVAARENASLNGLHNCEFIVGDVLKVLDMITERPDMIVLDPPRDGVHPKALQKIIGYGVENILYISCKPTSLARDLEAFLDRGYAVRRWVAVDQFSWTGHVETCVLLSRKKSGGKSTKIEIEIDLSEADRRECIGTATYQEIKDYVWEHYQTKVSHLYIAQIKKKCGLDVGENFNKPKTEGNKVPNCPEEKERMIREALEYFGMIKR